MIEQTKVYVVTGKAINIAEKYREMGHLDKALENASPTDQPQFRGECLLALARCAVLKESQDKQETTRYQNQQFVDS